MNDYLIEYNISSSLNSYDKDYEYKNSDGIVVRLLLSKKMAGANTFPARVYVSAANAIDANEAASEALTSFLDLVAYSMSTALFNQSTNFIAKGSQGTQRTMRAISIKTRTTDGLYLRDKEFGDIVKTINTGISDEVAISLRWLRWAYRAHTIPEAFYFYWLALESLIPPQAIIKKCGKDKCQQNLLCPKHGEDSYNTVPRAEVLKLCLQNGLTEDDFYTAVSLRHKLFHGSRIPHKGLRALWISVQKIKPIVEKQLGKITGLENIGLNLPVGTRREDQLHMFLSYETVHPDQKFPEDMLTVEEINEFADNLHTDLMPNPKSIELITEQTEDPDW